jgi:phenylalanyl-tRNA synthetase beta chain
LDIKAEIKALLEKFNIANYNINHYNYNGNFDFHLDYEVKANIIARISKFSDKFLRKLNIEKPLIIGEFYDLTGKNQSLINLGRDKITFKEYSNYPPVIRDLSIVVGGKIPEGDIERVILSTPTEGLLRKLRLYDIYVIAGENERKDSYTYTLEFRADDRTLTNDEINKLQEKIVQNLNKKLGAELRK